MVVVNSSFPAKTVPEFIAYAKANPGKINLASAGIGSATQVSGELFNGRRQLGSRALSWYGPVDRTLRAGKLRSLAVTTATRSEVLSDIPTVSEFVPAYEASGFFGVGAPRNTPAEIIDRLNKEINVALADPKMKARLADLGGTVLPGSPADFGKLTVAETEKWAKVIKFAGIKPE